MIIALARSGVIGITKKLMRKKHGTGERTMTEKDLEIQQLRRELLYTECMYKAQRTLNEHLMSISELLAAENAKLKAEIEKSGSVNLSLDIKPINAP